jgi:hypothetical protein
VKPISAVIDRVAGGREYRKVLEIMRQADQELNDKIARDAPCWRLDEYEDAKGAAEIRSPLWPPKPAIALVALVLSITIGTFLAADLHDTAQVVGTVGAAIVAGGAGSTAVTSWIKDRNTPNSKSVLANRR